jgi:Icc-related predicted phosphoesterase
MRLAVISDLHDSVEHVGLLRERGARADGLVVCGDFTTFGTADRIQSMADAVRLEGRPLFFVIGNCDAAAADVALEGCLNLHATVVEFRGWLFAGIGGALPCPSPTPRELREADYARTLEHLSRECRGRFERLILVSHQPPFGTEADCLPSGRHVGCRALRSFLDDAQPACCLTGHIHEARGRSSLGRTLLLNPGPFSGGNVSLLELP